MKRLAMSAALFAACGLLSVRTAVTAPRPSEVPLSWELNVEVQSPRAISLVVDGAKKTFWFISYTVTNKTGEDRLFIPHFLLYTDTGQTLSAGKSVPGAVFSEIKKALNDPLLQEPSTMTGKILQGDDNAKSSLAIWPDFDPSAGAFDVFIGGLSGEVAEIRLPEGKTVDVDEPDAMGNPTTVKKDRLMVAKTLHLVYSTPGEAAARTRTGAQFISKEWVMR